MLWTPISHSCRSSRLVFEQILFDKIESEFQDRQGLSQFIMELSGNSLPFRLLGRQKLRGEKAELFFRFFQCLLCLLTLRDVGDDSETSLELSPLVKDCFWRNPGKDGPSVFL